MGVTVGQRRKQANDHAPTWESRAGDELGGSFASKGQLTGEQHLISVAAGFPAGFMLVLLVVMVGLGWSTWPGLAAATVGGILGNLALVFAYSRWNATSRAQPDGPPER